MKSMKVVFVLLMALASFILPGVNSAQTAKGPAPIFIRAGRLFDSESGAFLPSRDIIIKGNLIDAVGEKLSVPDGARVSERLTVKQILPGVWIHTSWRKLASGVNFPANGLLVRNRGELVLIDTAWGADITKELFEWIDSELKLPVTLAIVTHFHNDSMGGTPVLAARGIRFVGLPLTRELGKHEGVPLPEPIADLKIGDAARVANVEVFYPGPGHSKDNLVVWVPESQVLFGSCAVREPGFPGKGNTADADLAGWPEAIRRVQKRYPNARIVVPGHGSPGDASLLSHTINLFKK